MRFSRIVSRLLSLYALISWRDGRQPMVEYVVVGGKMNVADPVRYRCF